MVMESKYVYIIILGSIGFLLLLTSHFVPIDYEFDVEYLNGILSASIFVLGLVVISTQLREPNEEEKHGIYISFLAGIFTLSISILFMYLSAIGLVPMKQTLITITLSFFVNLILITTLLRHFLMLPQKEKSERPAKP